MSDHQKYRILHCLLSISISALKVAFRIQTFKGDFPLESTVLTNSTFQTSERENQKRKQFKAE